MVDQPMPAMTPTTPRHHDTTVTPDADSSQGAATSTIDQYASPHPPNLLRLSNDAILLCIVTNGHITFVEAGATNLVVAVTESLRCRPRLARLNTEYIQDTTEMDDVVAEATSQAAVTMIGVGVGVLWSLERCGMSPQSRAFGGIPTVRSSRLAPTIV